MKQRIFAIIMFLILCGVDSIGRDAIYRYADGNGNVYIIKGGDAPFIEYRPVTPGESSSGAYSGGTHRKKKISRAKFNYLASLMDESFRHKEDHASQRVKGSGLVTVMTKTGNASCILVPASAMQNRMEAALKEMMGPDMDEKKP